MNIRIDIGTEAGRERGGGAEVGPIRHVTVGRVRGGRLGEGSGLEPRTLDGHGPLSHDAYEPL